MTSRRGCGKDVCCHRFFFNAFFADVTHAVVVRFSDDPDVVRDLVQLEENLEEDVVGVTSDPLT